MTTNSTEPTSTLDALVTSFRLHLLAENRSPRTVETYTASIEQLRRWLERAGATFNLDIGPDEIRAFTLDQIERNSPSTANLRWRSLQQFFRFLVEEGELESSPMAELRPPSTPTKEIPVLTLADIDALLSACRGQSFDDRRDRSIIAVLADTGMRKAELLGMGVSDVDLTIRELTITGKGRRTRTVTCGLKTAQSIDRYMRSRRTHPDAPLPNLWLGRRGVMTGSALAQMLARRGEAAGVGRVHPHRFRHSFAHHWLAAGGTEGDLMRFAGWSSRAMLDRYGASAASERARAAHATYGVVDRL